MAVVAQEWCHTYPTVQTVVFNWTISNFMVRCSSDHAPLTSSPFSQNGLLWCLEINLIKLCSAVGVPLTNQRSARMVSSRSMSTQSMGTQAYRQLAMDQDQFSLRIALVSGASPVWATYKFTLVSAADSECDYKKECNEATKFESESDYFEFGFGNFISARDIKKYLENDTLVIQCEVKILVNDSRIHHSSALVLLPVSTYKTNFKSLLQDGSYSDVTMVAGSKEFKSHKLVLCARSPVFAKMFEHDMKENAMNRVDITDIEPEILEELLVYIYTDESPLLETQKCPAQPNIDTHLPSIDDDTPSGTSSAAQPEKSMHEKIGQLLYAAEKYQLDRLKAMCEAALSRGLSVETATEVLLFAELHSTQQLKKSCIRFIGANFSEVIKTRAWMEAAKKDNATIETIQAIFASEV